MYFTKWIHGEKIRINGGINVKKLKNFDDRAITMTVMCPACSFKNGGNIPNVKGAQAMKDLIKKILDDKDNYFTSSMASERGV